MISKHIFSGSLYKVYRKNVLRSFGVAFGGKIQYINNHFLIIIKVKINKLKNSGFLIYVDPHDSDESCNLTEMENERNAKWREVMNSTPPGFEKHPEKIAEKDSVSRLLERVNAFEKSQESENLEKSAIIRRSLPNKRANFSEELFQASKKQKIEQNNSPISIESSGSEAVPDFLPEKPLPDFSEDIEVVNFEQSFIHDSPQKSAEKSQHIENAAKSDEISKIKPGKPLAVWDDSSEENSQNSNFFNQVNETQMNLSILEIQPSFEKFRKLALENGDLIKFSKTGSVRFHRFWVEIRCPRLLSISTKNLSQEELKNLHRVIYSSQNDENETKSLMKTILEKSSKNNHPSSSEKISEKLFSSEKSPEKNSTALENDHILIESEPEQSYIFSSKTKKHDFSQNLFDHSSNSERDVSPNPLETNAFSFNHSFSDSDPELKSDTNPEINNSSTPCREKTYEKPRSESSESPNNKYLEISDNVERNLFSSGARNESKSPEPSKNEIIDLSQSDDDDDSQSPSMEAINEKISRTIHENFDFSMNAPMSPQTANFDFSMNAPISPHVSNFDLDLKSPEIMPWCPFSDEKLPNSAPVTPIKPRKPLTKISKNSENTKSVKKLQRRSISLTPKPPERKKSEEEIRVLNEAKVLYDQMSKEQLIENCVKFGMKKSLGKREMIIKLKEIYCKSSMFSLKNIQIFPKNIKKFLDLIDFSKFSIFFKWFSRLSKTSC